MGYPCVRHYILFYIHGPAYAILHFLSYINIKKYKNSKWPLNGHFELIRSLADIAEHISQIKRRSDGNFVLKRGNKLFFVSGHSN